MKLLLDENIPHVLRHGLTGHDCYTVAYRGWSGINNGELLRLAAADGFDALISKDAGLRFQHDLKRLPLSIVVLECASNDMADIRPLIPALLAALETLRPRMLVVVS